MRLNSSIKHYSDKLIYDSSHEIDAGVFTVTLPTESKAAGTVKRGQIIYFDTTKKEYTLKRVMMVWQQLLLQKIHLMQRMTQRLQYSHT